MSAHRTTLPPMNPHGGDPDTLQRSISTSLLLGGLGCEHDLHRRAHPRLAQRQKASRDSQ